MKSSSREKATDSTTDGAQHTKQIKDLKSLLLQRDNEIAILVGMVKTGKTVSDVAAAERARIGSSEGEERRTDARRVNKVTRAFEEEKEQIRERPAPVSQLQQREEKIIQRHLFGIAPPEDKSLFEDPSACFEWFRERHELTGSIEDNKNLAREKSTEAKQMGERAQQSKSTINYLKNSIEAIRREKAIQGVLSREDAAEEKDVDEEETYRRAIEQEKTVYKDSIDRLRTLKPEIEHIKMLIEKGLATVQMHYDQWYNSLYSRRGVILQGQQPSAQPRVVNTLPDQRITALVSPRRHSLDNSAAMSPINSDVSMVADAKSRALRSSFVSTSSSKSEADDVNEDILAFYQAKEELLKRRMK